MIDKAFFYAVNGDLVDFKNVLAGKLDQRNTGRLSKSDNLFTVVWGEGLGEEPNHTTARKPGPL